MTIQSRLKGAAAPIALSIAFLAQPAFAQDDATTTAANDSEAVPANDQVIVVTGSITRNPAAATASPVVSISAEDLKNRGITTVADALQTLTANNAGTAPPSWSSVGFATGASAPSLRGLNDAYTLTLFNGMRSAFYPLGDDGYRNFVDINSLPSSIVETIDVLEDGASATYGSDAIAGVVNVIVKREIQGLHADGSYGQSMSHGDGEEYRLSATYGYGDLDEQGFNVFVNGEYQKNGEIKLNSRSSAHSLFSDLSSICGTSAQGCLFNGVANGIQYDGSYGGVGSTLVPLVRPYTVADLTSNTLGEGPYQMLNPGAGCQGLPSHTLTADELSGLSASALSAVPADHVVCQEDTSDYQQYNSPTERKGANLKATFKVGDRAEAYFMFNYYDVAQRTTYTPYGFTGSTTPPAAVTVNYIFLPAYVCPQGTTTLGTFGAFAGALVASGCDASNGTLNPNNPFAAQGQLARLLFRNPITRETDTNARTTRFSGGINGSFGSWNYSLSGVTSQVRLNSTNKGYIYLPGLEEAIATGSFNFVDFGANTEQQIQQIMPDNHNLAQSETTQLIASLDHDFFDLPGGSLSVAVTGQYRYEAIHDPSANPPDNVNPTQRYYGINSVGVDGSRRVWSAGYEITAPITDWIKVKAEGSYDHYSTGQSHFSPKFEAEIQPIEQLKLRGTYSKGFRIPSFAESFSLPTTGYVNASINCTQPTYAAFCAAHASNPAYYSGGYSYGLTSSGNPDLAPEKAESFTLGAVFEPVHHIVFTADYWQTKISNVIIPASAPDDLFAQYYGNNGVVSSPGITVVQGTADAQNPGALPLLGFVVGSYKNADSFLARGIDVSASANLPITNTISWHTRANGSFLLRLEQTGEDGTVDRYDGTLGPCNITSCSGAPKFRGVWQNTLDFNDRGSLTLTAYYTSGYSSVAADSGGVYGDCQASADNGQIASWADGSPVQCNGPDTFDLDGHAEIKVADKFTLYGDVMNILGSDADFDPNAAYGLYGFNPAWQDRLFVGRWFRVGVKVDW